MVEYEIVLISVFIFIDSLSEVALYKTRIMETAVFKHIFTITLHKEYHFQCFGFRKMT